MAKRVASSDLNHDNWDKEEESEDAGTFKTATDEAMKGRIVKKAKRRNLNEDQKKNVFSGISFSSGFSSTTDAFSFLKKDTNGSSESKENVPASKPSFGFVFGGSKPKEDFAPKPFGGFEFGTKKTETVKEEEKKEPEPEPEPEEPTNDLMSKFKPACGNWSCDVCMISNNADVSKCVACETPKPGSKIEEKTEEKKELSIGANGGFKFGGSATTEPATTGGFSFGSGSTETKPSGDLNSLFKPATGSWACDVCMISNKADVTKCVACETPKPGAVIEAKEEEKKEFSFGSSGGFKFGGSATSEPATTGGFSFGSASTETKPSGDLNSLFKPATGSWACDVCMISNKADVTKCVACETPKPGAVIEAKEEEKKEFSFGSGGGFKFGASTTSEPATTGGFSFGNQTSEEKPADDLNPLFKPATDREEEKKEFSFGSSGGFKFGASTTSEPATTGGFFFGTKTSEEKSTEPGPKIEELTEEKKELSFGSTGGFQFVASTTAESAKTGGVFTQASSNKTGFMFGSSTVKENENAGAKAGGLFEAPKGPFGTPAGKTSSNKSPQEMSINRLEYLGFVKALNLQVASCITKHVDRNPLIDLSPVFEDYQKHMKGIREKHGIQPKTQKSPMPSEISEQRSGEDAIEASTETMVQEETVKPVVEEEAFFSTKCKLFYLKEGKYEERGKGHIHLKKTKDLKTQVIIRSENVLGSILLNVIKTKDTRCEIVGDNNVLMVCVPNPPLAGEPVGPVSFLVRVKAEFCEDLFNHLESTKD